MDRPVCRVIIQVLHLQCLVDDPLTLQGAVPVDHNGHYILPISP
jgi:hypothetical protein